MHGLRPADFGRRTLWMAAAVAVPAAVAAVLALAAPAQATAARTARAGTLSVTIDSMNPPYAGPGATVSLAGTVSNGTAGAETGLEIQLYTSPVFFSTRDQMDGYLSQSGNTGLEAVGNAFTIPGRLRPGAAAGWRASFSVNLVGITEFGVYPVAAELVDPAGDVLATDQTLLPFWPGQRAADLERPLSIAWIWPLIDQPHHQACPALTNDDLAASLSPGGRLSTLLAAGQAHPGADLTWLIDPALLSDVNTMTTPYRVGGRSNCTGAASEPASKAAETWLSALRAAVASGEPTVITSYANVDAAALVHAGLDADLASAYATGYQVADDVLHGTFGPSIAVPAGRTADLSVLTTLAAAEHIGTVVLDSSEMPPSDPAVFEPDDAVTSVRTAAGTMNVLLADHILTGVLQAGDSSSGSLPAGAQFAVSQRFLAETAMIAAEAPDSVRSIVVAPPDGWSPPAALAGRLLSETVTAPWLKPTPLSGLPRSTDTYRAIPRRSPPAVRKSPGELSDGYLGTVSALGARLATYQAMLYQPSRSYLQSLDEALEATESSAWRGSASSQGLALADNLSSYLIGQEREVKIITSLQVPMGGASGLVPVSIQNGLTHAIQVRLTASPVDVPGRTSQLTIGHFQNLVTVLPQTEVTVKLPVKSAPIGPTAIRLSLTSANGTPLPFTAVSLTVLSTRYGRAILLLIAAAIGVLVLTSVYRGARRWLRADARAGEDADLAGSVVSGTSGARHATEAPDDLADARRRVDDA